MKTFHRLQREVTTPIYLKHFSLLVVSSGKSYVVKRTTGGLGMKIVNSDIGLRKNSKTGLSTDLRELDPEVRDEVRGKQKE